MITVQRPALQTNSTDFATDEAKCQQDHWSLVYFPPRGICTQMAATGVLPDPFSCHCRTAPSAIHELYCCKSNNPASSACHPTSHHHGSHGLKPNWDSAASPLQDTSLVPIPTTTTVPMLRSNPSGFAPLTWYQSLAFTAMQMQGGEEVCRHQWVHWQSRYHC